MTRPALRTTLPATFAFLAFTQASFGGAQSVQTFAAPNPPAPPPAAKVLAGSDTYFGTTIIDPYRWMEKGKDDPDFNRYLHDQAEYTTAVMAKVPGREKILERIHALGNGAAKVDSWQRAGGRIFYLELRPGANTQVLVVRDENGKSRDLLDPAAMGESGSHASISYFSASNDGVHVAVGVALGGSENATVRVVDVATEKLLPDVLGPTFNGELSWHDANSFFYTKPQPVKAGDPASAKFVKQSVYLHSLGADPQSEHPVFGIGAASMQGIVTNGFVGVVETPGSKYLIAHESAGTVSPETKYRKLVTDVANDNVGWEKLLVPADKISTHADVGSAVHGSVLYVLVEKDAPNRKLIAVDLDHANRQTVLLPNADDVLIAVVAAKDGLYVASRQGVTFRIRHAAYANPAKWSDIALPYAASVSAEEGGPLQDGVMIGLDTWTRSYQAWIVEPKATRNSGIIPPDPADVSGVESREVVAKSADGTMVPVSIICRKGIKLDGSHPLLLNGYGAYGISFDPFFSSRPLVFLEQGGIWVEVHVRGGGELGDAWHLGGQKLTKQHTIDDMIAAAQYMIAQGYTSPAHLAVMGTSAGGITAMGSVVQHPELFAAAIDDVGGTDLLRMQFTPVGPANISEFGDVNVEAEFHAMSQVSPYNNVKPATRYPAVLAITGANDPRVPAWVVAKMAARMQASTSSTRPVLLRVDFDAGHGMGSSRSQRDQQFADIVSFLLWQTGSDLK